MFASTCRFGIGVAFLIVLLSQAPAQDKKDAPKNGAPPRKDPADYRLYFNKPETLVEFWEALQFEIEVGKFDLAAGHLRGLLEKSVDAADELLQLEEEKGLAAILRLQRIPKWSNDAKVDAQAKKDAQELLQRVSAVLKAKLRDPKRIDKFIKNLSASPEERAFALRELYRSGAVAAPFLIEALRTAEGEDRLAILTALPLLSPDTIPPLLAALDINNDILRLDLIDLFQKRAASAAVPHLWHLAGSPTMPEAVRNKATAALSHFLDIPPSKLPPAKVALTREAERYYQHQAAFGDPDAVTVWRWDGKQIVAGWPPKAGTITARKAEEYYGLRFAQQALDIDPTYQPAQLVFLSLALERAVEQAGLDQPLTKGNQVGELVATVNPDLVVAVLDRALNEQRTPVILGAVRALGDLAEVRALRQTGQGEPALVRALTYAERRVQMAAADALLRIPGPPSTAATARIVDVLRRAVAVEPQASTRPKILIGYVIPELANEVALTAAKAGFDPIFAATGRDVLRRLNQAADIDAVLIDSSLPDPGLSSLLAQLRADIHYGRLPLFLTALPDREERLHINEKILRDVRQMIDRKNSERTRLQDDLKGITERYRKERIRLETFQRDIPESDLERKKRIQGFILQLSERALKEERRLEASLETLDERYDEERRRLEDNLTTGYGDAGRRREDSLRRLTERDRNVWVVTAGRVLDADWLKRTLENRLAEVRMPPLTEAERKAYAEKALIWLAKMGRGEVAGYDIGPAGDAILNALQSGNLSDPAYIAALQAAGRLPGPRPQRALSAVLLDGKRSVAIRTEAAGQLVRHIQQHSLALAPVEVKALQDLLRTSPDETLKASVALVIGSMRPDARQTGERLKGYTPPPPVPPEPPAPDKEKPDKDKPPDKDKDKDK